MTGLEPHPILELPTQEQALAMGPEKFDLLRKMRRERMQREQDDPFRAGYEAPIWHTVDDLLVDGHKVLLVHPTGIDVPVELRGASEVLISGSNRSGKSEYAGKKCMKVLYNLEDARGWSFADTGPISIARQQPLFWKYMPLEWKRLAESTGKFKQGAIANISYSKKGGFTEQTFVLPNGSQHWFKNYAQDVENVEGDQLDVAWFDELRNPQLLSTVRFRMGDRAGLVIVTFTAIDEAYTGIINEYDKGSRTVLEVEAELLPIRRFQNLSDGVENRRHASPSVQGRLTSEDSQPPVGFQPSGVSVPPAQNNSDRAPMDVIRERVRALTTPDAALRTAHPTAVQEEEEIIGYEKVPRIKVAGPGSKGNQRAHIVYFHITDNPYYGFSRRPATGERASQAAASGKERFYKLLRGAARDVILSRAYGILLRSSSNQFPRFNTAVHVVQPEMIPRQGTNYHIVDPVDGRNWFMIWMRVDARGRRYVYREWPSHGHPKAYIEGEGDLGPWTVPGKAVDGEAGPAQRALGWGLSRYREEILRLEGAPASRLSVTGEELLGGEGCAPRSRWKTMSGTPKNPLLADSPLTNNQEPITRRGDRIAERWIDSRYGAAPTTTKESATTLIEQMGEIGMDFLAAPGSKIAEGVQLINDALDYDARVPLGEFSGALARINEPRLYVSSECPNLIYSLREWTGRDGLKGASKDPIDCLRYAVEAELDYVGADTFAWRGGGSY